MKIRLKSRIIALGLVTGLVLMSLFSGCTKENADHPTGKPIPPFLGEVSPDAQVEDITSGNYGGTLILATPGNPKTFNPVTAFGTASAWIIGDTIYKSLTGYDNLQQKDVPGLAS